MHMVVWRQLSKTKCFLIMTEKMFCPILAIDPRSDNSLDEENLVMSLKTNTIYATQSFKYITHPAVLEIRKAKWP